MDSRDRYDYFRDCLAFSKSCTFPLASKERNHAHLSGFDVRCDADDDLSVNDDDYFSVNDDDYLSVNDDADGLWSSYCGYLDDFDAEKCF